MLILFFRVLAGMTVFVGVLGIWDVFLGAPTTDSAVVTAKVEGLRLEAKGRRLYREAVSKAVYEKCEPGSQLDLQLTPIFGEWKSVILQTPSGPVRARGNDLVGEAMMSLAFLGLAVVFLPSRVWMRWEPKWIMIRMALMAVSFAGSLVFVKLVLEWTGAAGGR